jgi:HEAT repeat protein
MTDEFDEAVRTLIERMAPAHRDVALQDLNSLRERGVTSTEDLIAVLNDVSAGENRARAGWLLGRLGSDRAVEHLTAALRDPDARLRAEAARSLGTLGDPRAVPDLVETLRKDTDPDARMSAAHALGLVGDDRVVDPLLEKLADRDENPRVRGAVAEALAGPQVRRAVPHLIAALGDASVEVRFWAAFALGELGDPKALGALERLAQTDRSTLPGWRTVGEEATAAIENIRTQHG